MAHSPSGVALNPADFQTFSGYIRALVVTELGRKDAIKAQVDNADVNFFEQLNRYLVAEGNQPIPFPEDNLIPQQLESILRDKLSYKNVMELNHPFASQEEVRNRANDPARQANLFTLYQAMIEYRKVKDPNFKQEEEKLRLWKREVETHSNGDLKLSVQPADSINFNERVIVIAPGISAIHSYEQWREYYFSQVESMLGGKQIYGAANPHKIQIYSLSYPNLDRVAHEINTHATNAAPYTHISPMVQHWVEDTLMPSLGLKEGHLLDDSALQASLSRLRFYGASYGSVILTQVRNALSNGLLAYGYSPEQIAPALAKVFVLNTVGVCRLEPSTPETGAFTTVNAVSKSDIVSYARADFARFVPDAQAEGEAVKARRINPNTWLYWDDAPPFGIKVSRLIGRQPEALQKLDRLLDRIGHDPALMAGDAIEPLKHGASRFHSAAPLQNLLRWAVSGKPMPDDITQAFEPCYLVKPSPQEAKRTRARTDLALRGAQRA